MEADKVTYADKTGVNPKETHINQVWDDDMNEIKLVINNNADDFDTLETEVDANTLDIIDIKAERAYKDVIVNKAANYTAIIDDYVLVGTSVAEITITLPTAIGVDGRKISVSKRDNNAFNVVIDTTLSQTINGDLTVIINNQYTSATFVSDGANWVIN